MKSQAVVLHDEIDRERATADDLDTLDAAESVAEVLRKRGYAVESLACTGDLTTLQAQLQQIRPAFVFQTVERIAGDPNLLPAVPLLLRHLGIPYSGCDAESLAATISKLHTKRWLRAAGIRTADWATMRDALPFAEDWLGIVKPESEHSSFGMDDSAVVRGPVAAQAIMRERFQRFGGSWFAETFLAGREFHVGILETTDRGPQILPPMEIAFVNFPPEKPRIMSFHAKWTDDSFEQNHTQVVPLSDESGNLIAELTAVARRCWDLFALSGYARIDLRTDSEGTLHVLEVNANPCFWAGSSFGRAADIAGFDYDAIIDQLIASAERRQQAGPTLNPSLQRPAERVAVLPAPPLREVASSPRPLRSSSSR